MDESVFLAEMKQNSGHDKKGKAAVTNSVDTVFEEKEEREAAEKDEKHNWAMEAEPGLQRLNVESARKARLGATVHRSKVQQLPPKRNLEFPTIATYLLSGIE